MSYLNRALYLKNDPYESSDAVFGVKKSLLVELSKVSADQAKKYNVEEGSALLSYDFVLVTEKESAELRAENSRTALEKLGRRVKIVKGLPVGRMLIRGGKGLERKKERMVLDPEMKSYRTVLRALLVDEY